MHQKLLVSKYTAIKRLLLCHLLNAISIYTKVEQLSCIDDGNIPLHRGRDVSRVLYISGVGLRRSKSHNLEAIEVANAIASHFSANCGEDFTVEIVPPGWIHFELSDRRLAVWLQSLASGVGEVGDGEMGRWGDGEVGGEITFSSSPASKTSFSVQYAHARCCSLLQLAHRERLIQLGEPDSEKFLPGVISPNPIPWLNSDKLCLNHSAERRLITQLVQVVDELYCPTPVAVNWEKLALSLSQAFESFWRECRIWGEVKISSPQLAQARVGLVKATQSVLSLLLQEKLGIFPPQEL